MRRTQFAEGEYYHIYNRGVEKRTIFLDRRDHERFLFLLFACNDTQPLLNSQFYYRGLTSIDKYPRVREPLVEVVCFCLMPNHFHLLLTQRIENGISRFMQKVSTGYTMYFNKKYQRSGALLQGSFKSIHVDNEVYLTHLTRYIHLNPVELFEPDWKTEGIHDMEKTHSFIRNYPWSSYSDYTGHDQYAKIITPGLIAQMYPAPKRYEQFVKEWLVSDSELISSYTIEV